MKPPAFDYIRADDIGQAIAALEAAGGDGKLIAGGQSLVPMMNFRLLRPSVLIDINHVPGLANIEEAPQALRIGALARHRMLETSPEVASRFPIVTAAMAHVAHLAIRNRGTIGGSLAHADPAAELPLLCVLLDARLKVRGPDGVRVIGASEFQLGALTTALGEADVLEEIELPYLPPGTGWGFEEVARRLGDFAIVAMGATITLGASVSQARIAITGAGDTPRRMTAAEALLHGKSSLDPDLIDAVAQAVATAIEPNTDLHASADYRRHLAQVLAGRVVRAAWNRAQGRPA